jgi:glycosyltransferase involved in cell wall biosynthesis
MVNTQSIKDKLTIIIPCKNEGTNIYECVGFISKQKNIAGTKVIIADCSNEDESIIWLNRTLRDFKYSLNIQLIEGGFPGRARLNGSKLVETPYMLFLDADVMLFGSKVIEEVLEYKVDLVTVPFQTEFGFNWIFRIFDIFQNLSKLLGTPFAVGGFQLFSTVDYWRIGGYKADELFAEDYSLSKKINTKQFKIHKTEGVWTSARRFKNKGIFFMFNIMIMAFINRNNPEFFKRHHNYWK